VLRALSRHDGSASRAGARLRIVTLGLADLWERAEAPAAEQAAASGTGHPAAAPEAGLRAAVSAYERQLVSASLARHQGSWAAAARELQLDRANLQRLAKRLEIDRP
jgi:anaerobic nitric oxide reductase transcription regulator